jgi:hypothetical protein
MAKGDEIPIESIRPGDTVLSIDGAGRLVPGEVGTIYRNVTTEWLVLLAANGSRDDFAEITVTPGHLFRRADGGFRRIDEIIAGDGEILLADGTRLRVAAERVVYSAETAHRYEQAEKVVYPTEGGLALAPQTVRGWRTYNFEVKTHHTYVAGNAQVHNDSTPTLAIAAHDFAQEFGHDFTGSAADLDLMMGRSSRATSRPTGTMSGRSRTTATRRPSTTPCGTRSWCRSTPCSRSSRPSRTAISRP